MLAKRIANITPSATSTLIGRIAELKESGEDIVAFSAGEPDFPTPAVIVDSCVEALRGGKTKYAAVGGILPLREAIAAKLKNDNGLEYAPNQITVSTGAKNALYNAIMAVCNPGEEIIVPIPCWVSYVEIIKLAEGIPVFVKTGDNFSLDLKAIREAVTPRTRGIIVNTPNNPTGAVYSKEDLFELGELAVEHDFYVIADEVYEKLVYDGNAHVSVGSLSREICKKTITINGFSKAFSMTGWRIGYAAAPLEISKAMTSLQGHMTSNSTTFAQWASIDALDKCEKEVEAMRQEFSRRRDAMRSRLVGIPGIRCSNPAGAFYLMPDVSFYFGRKRDGKVIENSADFCDYLLDEAKTAVVPGAAFEMPNAVRFSYATSMENIEEGMSRIQTALAKLREH